jgi:hypothetical protein
VAEREGGSYEDALHHARAVVAMLREALPDKEFSDSWRSFRAAIRKRCRSGQAERRFSSSSRRRKCRPPDSLRLLAIEAGALGSLR